MDNRSGTVAAEQGREAARDYPAWRRRRIFLIPGFQLRALLSVFGLCLLLVTAVDGTYFALQRTLTARALAVAPELKEMLQGQDQLEMGWLLVGSIVFLFGVGIVTLIESHRTAGPIFKLARTMERTSREGPVLRLRLRKDDHFQELEHIFNTMATSFQTRAHVRSAEARRILEQVDHLVDGLSRTGANPAELANRLRVVSSDLQKLEEDLEAC